MNTEYAKKVYAGLTKRGYTADMLGDEAKFVERMADEKNRRYLFDKVQQRGDAKMGSWEHFNSRMIAAPVAPKAEDVKPVVPETQADKSGYTFTAEELGLSSPKAFDVEFGGKEMKLPRLQMPEATRRVDPLRDFDRVEMGAKPMEEDPYKANYEKAKAAGETMDFESWMQSLPKAYSREDAVGANGELKAFIPKERIKSEEYGGLSREQAEFLRNAGYGDDVDAVKALNKTDVRNQVNESFAEITDAWNTVKGNVNEEYYGDRWYGKPLQAVNKAFFNTDATDFSLDKGVQSLRAADKLIGEAKGVMDAAVEKKGFFAGTGEALAEWNPVKSLEGLVDADAVEAVVKKIEEGKELSTAESALLDAFALNAAAHTYYDDEVSNWYNAGKVVGDMIPLAAEMVANPASGMARKWAQATLKRVAGKSLSKATKKALIYAAGAGGAFAGGATMAGTTGLPSVLEEAQKNTTGQAQFGINKSGEVGFTGVKEGGSFGEEFLKSLYRRGVENATEQMGAEWLTKWLGGVAGKAVKAIPGGKKAVEYVTDLVDNKYAHYLKELADKVNYQGPIEEFVEEIESAVLGTPVDGFESLKKFFEGDNLITTAIAVSVPGFGMGTVNALGGALTGQYKVGFKENQKRMQAYGRGVEAFGGDQNAWNKLAFAINTASKDGVEAELKRIYSSPDYTPEQKQRALEYAVHALKYRTAVEANMAMSDETTKMLNEMLGGRYDAGYNATDDVAPEIKRDYDMERERAVQTLGEDVVAALDNDPVGTLAGMNEVDRVEAMDYVNARVRYEGMIDRISDDIDERIKASDKEIESHANKADGMIHPATMRGVNGGAPRKVYIVSGNVATFEDGTIDKAKSSDFILVRDAETGEVKAASVDEFDTIDEVIDTATEKKSVADAIANQVATEKAAIIEAENGKLTYNSNDGVHTVEILGENGDVFTILDNGVERIATREWVDELKAQNGVVSPVEDQIGDNTGKVVESSLTDETASPVVEAPKTALEQIPRNENNVPLYEQVDSELAWDGVVEEAGGNEETAMVAVNSMVEDKKKALAAAEKAKAKAGVTIAEKIAAENERVANIEKAKADLAKWEEIAAVKAKRETAAVESAPVAEETQPTAGVAAEAQPAEVVAKQPIEQVAEVAPVQETQNTEAVAENVETELINEAENVNAHNVIKSEDEKKALRKRAEKWAKKLGVKVHVLESYDEVTDEQAKVAILEQRVPGWFAGGEVYIYMPHLVNEVDLDRTVVHESVAHKGIKQMLGKEFNKFLDNVWNAMSVPARAKFLSYVGAGKNATQADRRAAADEYVAALAEKVYKKQGMTAEEKTIWQKFADWFRKKFNVDEAKAEVLSKETLTDEDIAKMIRASYETLQSNKVDNEVASVDGDRAMFSLGTYRDQGRDVLENYLGERVKGGFLTEGEALEMMAQMDDIYEICEKYTGVYEPFGNWSEAEVISDKDGKPVFSVIKSNGDYHMNLDFSLVCKKRRTLDAVFDEMISRGIISSYNLDQVDIAKINAIIREFGFETACRLCFVDAKRFRAAKVADVFCEMYNELSAMDEKGLKAAIREEKKNTVRKKTAKMLLEHPENRVQLSRDNFMSAKGFDNMKVNKAEIMTLYNSKKGTGGPKASSADVQYLNDVIDSSWTPEKAFAVGGVRLQSFSDYVPRMVFDYIQLVADLSAKGLPVHAYTKEPLFAKTFGMTGIKINLSLVPRVDADGVAPGLDKDGNYAWQDGETFPYEEAMALQSAPEYKNNCGTIAVGVSDEHILKMLGDENIRMVIPYHKSGLNAQVAKFNNIDRFTDYTNEQNTRDKNGKSIDKKMMAGMPDFNVEVHENGDPRAAAQKYLDWCDANGFLPKFDKFRDHPNYYKLLEDFTTIVTENGVDNVVPQMAVTMTFPNEMNSFGSLDGLIRQGLEEDAVLEGKRSAEVGKVVDAIQEEFDAELEEKSEGRTMFRLASSNTSAIKYDKMNGTNVKEFFDFLRGGMVFEKGKPNVFHIANAGNLLERYGIKGKFMVGQFTFSKEHTQDEDHELGVKEWVDVINNLNNPLAIASYRGRANEFRIYTYATINGKNICVGVIVSLKDGKIELANIISAYGRDINNLLGKEGVNLLYPDINELKRRISQVSTGPNSPLNATSTASADKDNTGSAKKQGNGTKFRKVTPEMDAEYMAAVENGDMETAERLVKEAAKLAMPDTKVVDRKGFPKVVYHGTPNEEQFFEFDTEKGEGMIFLTTSAPNAEEYTRRRGSIAASPIQTGRVMPTFVNIENPLIVDANKRLWRNINVDWSDTPVTTRDIAIYAKENGYDGAIIKKVRDHLYDDDTRYADVIIAFNPNQVKSSGASYEQTKRDHFPFENYERLAQDVGATYDDNGNVIPLSERFNEEKEDIRFRKDSMREHAAEWADGMQKQEPKQWAKIVEAMKLSPVWSMVEGDDNSRAAEVLQRLSDSRVNDLAQKEIGKARGVIEKAEAVSRWYRIKNAISDFWNWVQRNVFGTEPKNWEDFVDEVIGDYEGKTKAQRLQERIGSLARDVLNAVFKQSGIDIDLAEPVEVEQVAVVETENGELNQRSTPEGAKVKGENQVQNGELETENGTRQTENGSISSVGTEENGSQAASEPQARSRNMNRETWKKAFKKGGEKAYDLMYELHGGIVSRFPQEFLAYLKGVVGVPSDVANVVEVAHNYLVHDFKNKNPELFKVEDAPAVSDVHSLLATKGYSLLEHTMDNGKAIGVKMMYRDKFVPSGQTDTSYTPEGSHGRSVICYYSDPDSRLHQQYVFTVTKNNATETPTAYELAADPSLMTAEWAEHLEKTGRKNEDGSYNLEGLQPDFSDPFSLSHLMIRIGKTSGDVEIISRYNHGAFDANGVYQQIAGQPNATLDGNLNKLASGLYGALAEYKNIKPQDVMLAEGVKIADDGKVYRFTRMAGDIYVGDGFWIKDNEAHVVDRNKERMVGDVVVGKDYVYDIRKNIKIPVRKAAVIDGGIEFVTGGEAVSEIREIEVNGEKRKVEKTTWKGGEKTTLKDNVLTTEITDGELLTNVARMARPEEIVATDIKEVGDGFLSRLAPLERVEMPNLERVGDDAFSRTRVAVYSFPKLREVGDGFLPGCTSYFGIEFPSLEKVGDEFMSQAGTFGIADGVVILPKLREVGDAFLQGLSVQSVVFKSLEVAGDGFLQNAVVKTIGTPELRQVGENFMSENANKVEVMSAPKLENVPADFMQGNTAVRESIEEQRQEYLEEQQESEETMFRKMNKHAEEFNKTHKGGVPVVEIDPNNMEAELAEEGFDAEYIKNVKERMEKGAAAFYDPDRNLIYLLDPTLDKKRVYSYCWHENTHVASVSLGVAQELKDEFYSLAQEKKKENLDAFLKALGYEKKDYPEESMAHSVQAMAMLDKWEAGILSKLTGSTAEGAQRQMEIIQPLIDYINNGRQGNQSNLREDVRNGDVYDTASNEASRRAKEEGTGATATGGLTESEIALLEASTGYTREEIIDMFGYDLNREGAGPLTDREVVMESDPYSKVLGKPRYYGKRQREFVARQRRRMAEKARQVAEKLNLDNVEVLESTEGLTGKKATSKGWFDPRTGKITVVVPNHGSTGDIVETVLHEAVAHYGLRKLFGENFKNFLDNVYRNVTPEIRAEITELAKKHGWDFHTATEEYLASLAENTNFEKVNPSLWSNIKSFFMKMLAKVGITFDEPLGDNELRYILWRSHQNLVNPGWFNVFGQAEDIAKQYELGVGNYQTESGKRKAESGDVAAEDDSALLHREGGAPGSAQAEYNHKVRRPNKSGSVKVTENVAGRLVEAYQDSMRALKVLQDAIATETGKPIADNENAYMAENRMSSANQAQIEVYMRDYYAPLMEEVRKMIEAGVEYEDIIRYLHAKHGIERNEYMRRKQAEEAAEKDMRPQPTADMPNFAEEMDSWNEEYNELVESYVKKFAKRDYSGITALTESANAVEAETAAQQMVDEFETAHDTKPLWKTINRATKETLRHNFTSGLIDRATYDSVSTMFDFYIPLRGWDANVAANEYEYLTSNKPMLSPTLKTMHGRQSLADNPLATIAHMAESAIVQGNRNLMKQRFLNFVMNNPTSLATVSEQWYVLNNATNEWEPYTPTIPEEATPEQVVQIVEQFEADMLAKEREGVATRKRAGLKIGLHATKAEGQEHVVRVKRNGKEYCIYINGSPRAAQAVNGLTNPDVSESKAREIAQTVKNFMARAFTSMNPAFIITNLSRDVIWAGTAVAAKEDAAYVKQYTKNITGALFKLKLPRLLRKFQKGTLDMNNEVERYFNEFMLNGGETGFTQVNTVEDYKKNIKRFVDEVQNGTRITKKAWRGFWNGIEFLNRSAEDVTRFNVYMTSRQMGRNIAKSVWDAKEITVNFNKKGSGELGAGFMNFAYIFFNATIQSIANFGKIVYNNPGKTGAALAAFSTMGLLMPLINAALMALGDDDDEEMYWNLPDWVRRNNIVLFVPWTEEGFITIPLPHELRPFYGMGEAAYSALAGRQEVGDAISSSARGFTELLPLDFTGNGGDAVINFTPTIAQPIVQIARNTDYFGKPIYRDNPFNKRAPEWTKAYKGTNSTLVAATKWLNELGGGDDVKSGGALDWNPAWIEYMVESYLGGVGKTMNKAYKTVSMIWDEDMREVKNIPVASSFYQSADEKTEDRSLNERYFNLVDGLEDFEYLLNGYRKKAMMGEAEYEDKFEDMANSGELDMYQVVKEYSMVINELNSTIKNYPLNDTEKKDIEATIRKLKQEMLTEVDKLQE